jgi:hypothetical protein
MRPIAQISRDLGKHPQAVHNHTRQAEVDSGTRQDR